MSEFVLEGQELEKLKAVEIAMLKECIDICDSLGLKYYLIDGTLLGAVRHKGFIPWDDDIDICLMREDYEIFKKEAGKMLSENLFLQCTDTDPDVLMNYIKIRNSATTFIETSSRELNINHGVYIDIFPIDYHPDSKIGELVFLVKKHCLRLCVEKGFNHKKRKRKLRNRIVNGTIYFFLSWIKPKKAVRMREKLYMSNKKGDRVANYSSPWGMREVTPISWYGEGVFLEFEGLKVRCPKEYDKWLTRVYGNYMEPPPPEKRVSHHFAEVIDLDRPYPEYRK